MNYSDTFSYHGCSQCNKPCQTTQTVCQQCQQVSLPVTNNCYKCGNVNCGNTDCHTCSQGYIAETTCNPTPCLIGCEETISSKCVILKTYCLINGCNCAEEAINLDMFLIQLCAEITKIKADIDCLKESLPLCGGNIICTLPVFTNSIF